MVAETATSVTTTEVIDEIDKCNSSRAVISLYLKTRETAIKAGRGYLAKRWDKMFAVVEDYKGENGNCLVPARYAVTPALGRWVMTQRHQYQRLGDRLDSHLTPERIAKLNDIDFAWSVHGDQWDKMFDLVVVYKGKNGNCNVPTVYEANPKLDRWVHIQRQQYRQLDEGRGAGLTPERIAKLKRIGFSWSAHGSQWDDKFDLSVDYKEKHGDCNVPRYYTVNPKLGRWVSAQRTAKKAFDGGLVKEKGIARLKERIAALEGIGFVWSAC